MRRQLSDSAMTSTGSAGDLVVLGGAGAHVDFVGLEADEPRHREPARRAERDLIGRLRAEHTRHEKSSADRNPQPGPSRHVDPAIHAVAPPQRPPCLGPAIC
jgi:hypothetical protein